MKLLNLCCGGVRPQSTSVVSWINLDDLHSQLAPGTEERKNLDAETNYVNANVLAELPFSDGEFDGILASHCIEHFPCHAAVKVLKECHRIMKLNGMIIVTVPDSQYFLDNYDRDNQANAVALFGEPISEPWHEKFFDYALFHKDHQQLLTDTSLKCLMIKAGFQPNSIHPYGVWHERSALAGNEKVLLVCDALEQELNRLAFSSIMLSTK